MKLWPPRSNVKTVRVYLDAFNSGNFAVVEAMLAEDVCMIDSAGGQVQGRAKVVELIKQARALAPDYQIRIDRIGRRDSRLYISGESISSDPRISGATHFRVRADHQHIFEWQSFSARPTGTIAHVAQSVEPVVAQPC